MFVKEIGTTETRNLTYDLNKFKLSETEKAFEPMSENPYKDGDYIHLKLRYNMKDGYLITVYSYEKHTFVLSEELSGEYVKTSGYEKIGDLYKTSYNVTQDSIFYDKKDIYISATHSNDKINKIEIETGQN